MDLLKQLSSDEWKKSIYIAYFKNGLLLFASEIKSFMSNSDFSVEVNYDSLNEYFN